MRKAAPTIPLTADQQATVAANYRLAWGFAKQHAALAERAGISFEDLVGHAYIGLCTAAQQHDPAKGAYSTIAWWKMRGVTSRALELARRAHDVAMNASQIAGNSDLLDAYPEDAEHCPNADDHHELRAALADLPERLQLVLTLRFGLDGAGVRTLEETGRALGVTKERIRQIEEQALVKLHRAAGRHGLRWSTLHRVA